MTVEAQHAIGNDVLAPPGSCGAAPVADPVQTAPSPALCRPALAYWEFHVRYFEVEALLLPPPSHIAVSFWNGMASGLFLKHFGITIYRALSGFCDRDGVRDRARRPDLAVPLRREDDLSLGGGAADGAQDRHRAAHSGVVRLRIAIEDRDGHARCLLPGAGQHHHRLAQLRAEQARSHALLPGQPVADLSPGRAAERAALHLRRPERRGRLQHPRRAGRRVRRVEGRHRLSDPRCQLSAQHPARVRALDLARPVRDHRSTWRCSWPTRSSYSGTNPRTSRRPESPPLQPVLGERNAQSASICPAVPRALALPCHRLRRHTPRS